MFGMGLTRFLPERIRRWLLFAVQTHRHGSTNIRFQPLNKRRYNGRRVAVVGLFSIQCGLQRAAELMAISYQIRGVSVLRFDLAGLLRLDTDRRISETKVLSALRDFAPTDVIVHAPPPMFERFLVRWGKRAYRESSLIAYWHWELPAVPTGWETAVRYCDEIWVPTPFVKQAIISVFPSVNDQTHIVPNPIEVDPFPQATQIERTNIRANFGLLAVDFICGFTFSMASGFERKNPLGAIAAFRAAFPTENEVRLVIRCHDHEKYPAGWARLVHAASEDPRIVLSDGAKVRFNIRDFYATLDVLVSLHRSEGFGLTIAEAAQSGANVVTTNWGLAPELRALPKVHPIRSRLIPVSDGQGLYVDYSSQLWAEPSYAEAAKKIRELYLSKKALRSQNIGSHCTE